MFGLHAPIVLIRYVTHFHSAAAPGDAGASLQIQGERMPLFLTLNSFFKTCPEGFRGVFVWTLIMFSFSSNREVVRGWHFSLQK